MEDYDGLPENRPPLRAIVKDLVLEDTQWTPRVANKMLQDLRKIRKLEIYVMNIKPENYKGGLLVDFSIALTDPHVVFDIKPDFHVQGYKNQDLIAFDAMMRKQKVRTTIRAFRNIKTMRVCKVSLDLAGDGLLQFFGGGNYTGFLGHGAVRLALAIQKSFGLSGVTAIVTESAFWSYGTLYSKYQGGIPTAFEYLFDTIYEIIRLRFYMMEDTYT
ncbi:MAG: hypothetical protein L6R38_003627 [Xanthoria sp. 2 TBL-2021]|nr:MAG: hypothetical protein L6R38_003627 [Xanthoria sp. 2 TBL-2021]